MQLKKRHTIIIEADKHLSGKRTIPSDRKQTQGASTAGRRRRRRRRRRQMVRTVRHRLQVIGVRLLEGAHAVGHTDEFRLGIRYPLDLGARGIQWRGNQNVSSLRGVITFAEPTTLLTGCMRNCKIDTSSRASAPVQTLARAAVRTRSPAPRPRPTTTPKSAARGARSRPRRGFDAPPPARRSARHAPARAWTGRPGRRSRAAAVRVECGSGGAEMQMPQESGATENILCLTKSVRGASTMCSTNNAI